MSNVSSSSRIFSWQGSLAGRSLRALRILLKNKSLVATVGTSFMVFAITAVQGVLLARLLGPEMRGEFGTIFLYTQMLTFIGLFGTEYALARRAAKNGVDLVDLRRCAIRTGLMTGLITFAVVAVLSWIALPADKQHLAMLCIFCAMLLPIEHIRLSLMSVDHGSSVFWRFNLADLSYTATFPILLIGLLLFGSFTLENLTLMRVFVSLVGLMLLISMIKKRGFMKRKQTAIKTSSRTIIKEGVPYAFSVTACDLFARLDLLLVLWLTDFMTQGFYVAAVPAVSLLLVTPKALALFSFNAGAKENIQWTLTKLMKSGLLVLGFQVIVALAYAIVLPWLIVFVYGIDFQQTVPIALALIPATTIAGCATVADGFLRGRNQSSVGVWSRVAAAMVMVVGVLVLHPYYGVLAIPYAACLGQIVNLAWMLLCIVRNLHGSTPRV